MRRTLLPLLVLLAFAFGQASYGQAPELQAVKLPSAPTLDGDVLDDPAWTNHPSATGFIQVRPYDGQPASERTEVYVGYTSTSLFIGVVCYDREPDRIIATDARRDASLEDTDSFQVIIDAFQDQQNGFIFGTNPAGIEFDAQVTQQGEGQRRGRIGGGGFNINWDTTWAVRSRIGEHGWSAEFAIPFASLRYGSGGEQNWGINFQRTIRRINEVSFWAPIPRQYSLTRVSLAGQLAALEPPSQRNLKFTPYVLGEASRGGVDSAGLPRSGTDTNDELGFDAKWSITPSLTLDATYNTDFAQVEVDELQVNLDRFSLFFPEKRPFFLENAGQFSVGTPQEVELFFSRRIGISTTGVEQPIDGGVRLSGKIGPSTNVGLLHMRTEDINLVAPQNDFTVARINQEFANRTTLGAMFVERDGDGSLTGRADTDYNRVYAVDGRLGFGERWTLSGYAAASDTPGRRGKNKAYNLSENYESKDWSQSLSYTKVEENFNPEVGFLARSNYEKASAFVLRRYRPADFLGLYELRPHIAFRGFWDDTGFWETGFLHVDNHWEWRNGWEIHTGVNFTHEGIKEPFEINEGTFVLPGEYDHEEAALVLESDEGRPFSVAIRAFIGGFFGGDRTSLQNTLRYRAGDNFSSELTWIHNDIDLPVANGNFEVNVARLRLSYAFTPKILLQALVQYDDRSDLVGTNLRFSWLQSANAGLYLVYNEVDDDTVVGPIQKRREFILKYSRIIDLL